LASSQTAIAATVTEAQIMLRFRESDEAGFAALEALRASIKRPMFCAAFVALEGMVLLKVKRAPAAALRVVDVALSGRFALTRPNDVLFANVHEVRGLCLRQLDRRHEARDAFVAALRCKSTGRQGRLKKRLAAANLACKRLAMSSTLRSGAIARSMSYLRARGLLAFAMVSTKWKRCATYIWARALSFPPPGCEPLPRIIHDEWPLWATLPPYLYIPRVSPEAEYASGEAASGPTRLWAMLQLFLYRWTLKRRGGALTSGSEWGRLVRSTDAQVVLDADMPICPFHPVSRAQDPELVRRVGSLLTHTRFLCSSDLEAKLAMERQTREQLLRDIAKQEDMAYHVEERRRRVQGLRPMAKATFLREAHYVQKLRSNSRQKESKMKCATDNFLVNQARRHREDEGFTRAAWALPYDDGAPLEVGQIVLVRVQGPLVRGSSWSTKVGVLTNLFEFHVPTDECGRAIMQLCDPVTNASGSRLETSHLAEVKAAGVQMVRWGIETKKSRLQSPMACVRLFADQSARGPDLCRKLWLRRMQFPAGDYDENDASCVQTGFPILVDRTEIAHAPMPFAVGDRVMHSETRELGTVVATDLGGIVDGSPCPYDKYVVNGFKGREPAAVGWGALRSSAITLGPKHRFSSSLARMAPDYDCPRVGTPGAILLQDSTTFQVKNGCLTAEDANGLRDAVVRDPNVQVKWDASTCTEKVFGAGSFSSLQDLLHADPAFRPHSGDEGLASARAHVDAGSCAFALPPWGAVSSGGGAASKSESSSSSLDPRVDPNSLASVFSPDRYLTSMLCESAIERAKADTYESSIPRIRDNVPHHVDRDSPKFIFNVIANQLVCVSFCARRGAYVPIPRSPLFQ
jgi:hypothetical protein